MNMQNIIKQAQKVQGDMLKEKKIIDETTYEVEKSFIKVNAKGNKKIESIKINESEIDDIEMLEDLLVVAINELISKIDDETEKKMGKYTKGFPGLF